MATTATYKAQISDGEQIECEEYEVGDSGVELDDEDGDENCHDEATDSLLSKVFHRLWSR